MKKYLVAVVVILALFMVAGPVWSQYPSRDYFANYFYVSGLMQVNADVPVLNYGYYYQTYNYNTADAFRVDYHGVGNYIMNLQANGSSVLLLNKAGDIGLGKAPSYRFDMAALDQDAQRGINFTSLSAGDGETIYGIFGAGTVGTGVCSADREVYGKYLDLTINADADPGYAGVPYIYGSFQEFIGSTDATTLKPAFGYVNHWNDYSGDNTEYIGFLDSPMFGGTTEGTSFEGSMNLESGDALGATGVGFGVDILEAGTNDIFYGVQVNDTNLGVIGGTGYGVHIDLDDVNWDTVYSIYVNDGSAVSYFGNSVGIGISPAAPFHVHTGDAENAMFITTDGTTRDLYTLYQEDRDGAPITWVMGYDQSADAFKIAESTSLDSSTRLIIDTDGHIRAGASEWYNVDHMPVIDLSPGGSGPVQVVPDANTLGGYNLDDDAEYIYFTGHVHDDWDGASDILLEIAFEVDVDNTGGNIGDDAEFDLLCYYKTGGETANKTQVPTVAVTVDQSPRYKLFSSTIVIDYDIGGGNNVEADDIVAMRINFDATNSDITDVVLVHMMFKYQTTYINEEI